MAHETSLIATIVVCLVFAFVGGFVADERMAGQLAEIGVILLMFRVLGAGLVFALALSVASTVVLRRGMSATVVNSHQVSSMPDGTGCRHAARILPWHLVVYET
jgi:predicted Kef-type K+ transport protein